MGVQSINMLPKKKMRSVAGGVFKGSYAIEGGVGDALPVDLMIPGCPPTPTQLLEGLLALLDAQRPKK